VKTATFSPDGHHIATASPDKTARLWEAETGKCIAVLGARSFHANRIDIAVFTADGDRLLTVSDGSAGLWAKTGKLVASLEGDQTGVLSAAFSRDGSRIITASHDAVRLWDATTGGPLAVLRSRY
jgi:WD40 repeat protein